MKKKIILILIFVSTISYGQKKSLTRLDNFDKKNIRYGFYLGLHQKGYALKTSNATLTNGAGFHLGVLADVKVFSFLNTLIEPGIISSSSSITFGGEKAQLPVTYFHLPVLFKLQTKRLNNVKGFILGGASYNYNFTFNRNNNDNGSNPRDFKLKEHTFMAELGVGASFYYPYFKFSPSIRAIYGLQNEFIGLGDIAKNNVSDLRTRGIFLNLTFQ